MAAMGGGRLFALYGHEEILKKCSLKPLVQVLKQFYRNVLWVTLFKNCSQNFDPSKNMAAVGGGLFALYGHEILKKIFFSETAGHNLE